MKKPPITLDTLAVRIDDLAVMTGRGFKGMNERIDGLEGHIDVLEQKINTVNSNVLALQYDYKKVVSRIENLELRTFGSLQE